MEGHQRAIIGSMTMEALYSDRHEFANQVREVCKEDLLKMGMEVVSYVITDIKDNNEYFTNLGVARTVEVQKNAEVGREKYLSEIKINKAMCNSQVEIEKVSREQEANATQQAKFTLIAEVKTKYQIANLQFQQQITETKQEADRSVIVQQKGYDGEIGTLDVRATKARTIEEQKQQVLIENEKKMVVKAEQDVILERTKGETSVSEQRVLKEEFDQKAAEVVVAQQKGQAKEITAQADKTVITTMAEADAKKVNVESVAHADAIKVKGFAQAEVIKQRGEAEADAMKAKAEAWKQYSQGAFIDMILQQLPEIAQQIAQPLSKTEKIVMISNGNDQGSGAQRLTKEITTMVSEVPAVAQSLTGIDIKEAISKMAGGR